MTSTQGVGYWDPRAVSAESPPKSSSRVSAPVDAVLGELVWRHFFEDVRLEEPRVTTYVASLLADFARTENLYRIRDAQGKRLEEVGEMLVESNPLLEAASFDRERELRKHVGDYTLFMTGLFPESVAKARRTRHPCRDAFIDFVQAGKESY